MELETARETGKKKGKHDWKDIKRILLEIEDIKTAIKNSAKSND